MSDYTPTTEEVRNHYAYGCGPEHTWQESREDFDRWLADVTDKAYRAGFESAAALAEQGETEGEHVFIERYGVYHAKFGGIGGDVSSLGLTREAWKAMGEPGVVAVSVSPVEQERKTDG